MKRLLPSLLLLLCVHAEAQIVGTVRQSYGPYQRPSEGDEPALASSAKNVLLAWSEVDPALHASRIRFGLLDFKGRLVSPITTVQSPGRAESPAVATDGTNFRLVYFEYRVDKRIERRFAMGVDIDAAGTLVGGPFELHAYERGPDATFPIVYWNGSSYTFVDRPVDEAALTIDEHLSGATWVTKRVVTGCFLFQCFFTDVNELEWWAVNGVNGSYRPPKVDPGATVMAGIGNHTTIAWNTVRGVEYLELLNGARKGDPQVIPASVPADDHAGLGCDDTHCLLAFSTRAGDIYGVLYAHNQPAGPQVAIELGSQFSKPHVQVLQKGRFLVSYVSAPDAPQHFMAGRIVTTEPEPEGRRRAVR
jgi:hypothetical protein